MRNVDRKCRGASIIEAAILLPLLIYIILVLVDLGRVFSVIVFCQQVAFNTLRLAVSFDPQTSEPTGNTVTNIVNPVQGESTAVTDKRKAFWSALLDSNSSEYHGLPYFTEKEVKVLNLAYGFINQIDSDVAFPIPYPLTDKAELGNKVNCSIYFSFQNLGDVSDTKTNRDRVYTVKCIIPLYALDLIPGSAVPEYFTVQRSIYAYKSGDISPPSWYVIN